MLMSERASSGWLKRIFTGAGGALLAVGAAAAAGALLGAAPAAGAGVRAAGALAAGAPAGGAGALALGALWQPAPASRTRSTARGPTHRVRVIAIVVTSSLAVYAPRRQRHRSQPALSAHPKLRIQQ